MVSHKELSGFRLVLGKGGLRFSKRPSEFNSCIAQKMRGASGTRVDIRNKFKEAAGFCSVKAPAEEAVE